MNALLIPEYIAIALSALIAVVGWIVTDALSKRRVIELGEKITALDDKIKAAAAEAKIQYATKEAALAQINNQNTISQQDRLYLHAITDRLDQQKASKDVVDGFRGEMATMRNEIERRFDQLERLLTRIGAEGK